MDFFLPRSDEAKEESCRAPCAFKVSRTVECVGRRYVKLAELTPAGGAEAQQAVIDEMFKVTSLEELKKAEAEKAAKAKPKATTSAKDEIPDGDEDALLSCTHYQILGCGEQGFGATLDQIKKGYHKALLKYHPDKTGRGETDPVFLKVQAAFNTLSDTTKRRAYDSQCEVDDTIPNGQEVFKTEEEFYKLYGDTFARNARFSETLPAPAFGGAELTGKALFEMYAFWGTFKSWRNFDGVGEHDVDAAEAREEKRWMMKENDREAKKAKKKENIRLTKMVDLAKKFDPRLKREREQEKLDKQAKKDERENKKKAEEDRIQKEADEKKKIEDEKAALSKNAAKEEKAIRDKQKKALRKHSRAQAAGGRRRPSC